MSGNRVEELGNYYGMEEGFALAHLDASGNRLTSLDREALLPSIKKVGRTISQIGSWNYWPKGI